MLVPIALGLTIATQAQTPTPTPAPSAAPAPTTPAIPAANPADVATMDSIIAAVYDVISGPPGKRDWDRMRSLFHPGARLIPTSARPAGEAVSRILTVDDYIQQRVDDQVDGFYLRRVNEYSKKVKQGEAFSLVFGALALVLGVISATAKFGWTAGWVAVIGTSVAAVVAYQSAARYQFLVVTYEATANRLKKLKRDWQLLRKTDTDRPERDEFILKCEEAISIENSAWMAEWTKSAKS